MKKAFILTGALLALLVILLLPKNEVNAAVSDGTPDNGWYTIQTKTNATFRIGTDKNNLILQKSANTTDQKFKLIKISNGVYRIGTGRSAGMLFLKSGIKQIAYDGSKAMQWKLEYDTSGKFYYIKNINSGKYLTYASLKNGVQATEAAKKNDDTQKFILTPYTPNYTVTFKDDTKVIKRQAVKSGKAATAPANPAKTGYNFNGWDKAYTNVKSNLVIKPKWSAKTVKVVFHINIPNDTRTYTETYTYDKINSFGMNLTDKPGQFGKWDRTGYSLSGWAFENNATNAQYPIYCGVENQWINKNSPGTVDLYAIWKPKKYTVTFKNGTTTLKTQQVEYTKGATAPAAPTKTGYIFDGWDKTFNNITGNLTVNAKWKAKTVKVVFHYNGDIKENVYGITNETFTETYTYGKTNQSFGMTLHDILNTTELPGEFGKWDRKPVCSLLGWSFDKNATTAKYSNYNEVKDGWIDSNAGTVDLYAVWNKKTGWFTVNGIKKYYIKGDRARGLQKIGDTYYIFGKTDKKAGIEYAKGNELHIGAFWGERRYPLEPEKNNGRKFSFFYLTFDGKNLYPIDGANDFERTFTNKGLKRGEETTEILYSKDYRAVNEKNEVINSLVRNTYNHYGKNYAACINSEGVVYKEGLFYLISNSEYASTVGSNVDFAYYTTKDFKEYTLHKGPLTKIKPDNLNKYNLYKGTKENQTEENTKDCLTLDQQTNTEYRWAPEIFCDNKNKKIYVFFSGQTNIHKYPEKLKKEQELDSNYKFNIYMSKEIKNENGKIEWATKKCEFLDSNGGTTGVGAWEVGIEPKHGGFKSFIDAQVFQDDDTQDGDTYYMAVKRDDGLGDKCAYLLLYQTKDLEAGKWKFVKVLDDGSNTQNLFNKTKFQYTYDADTLSTVFTGKYETCGTEGFEGPSLSKINGNYFLYTDHYIYNPTYLVNCKISKFMQYPVQYDATIHYASGSKITDLKYDRYKTWNAKEQAGTGEKNINNYTLNAYATNIEAYTNNKQDELISRGHPLRHGSINKIPDDAFSMLQKIYNIPKTETDAAKTYTVKFYAGNTLLSKQQVGFNKSATQPIEEAKKHTPSDKKFTGWDTQYQNIIGDIKISAVYLDLYNITYKGIDNTTVYKPEIGYVPKVTKYTKVDTSKVEMPLYTPVKTGYTFDGWKLNGINIGTQLPLKTEGNITLTATWK